MGLFSKKEYICEKCGKAYTKRINLNGNLCDDCWSQEQKEKNALESSIRGYAHYASDVLYKSYSSDEMRQIINHRDDILDRFKQNDGISRMELQVASDNYKNLTDDQAADILLRVAKSSLSTTMGAAYSEFFFVPTHYENMIVAAEDVFAVAYTSALKLSTATSEGILCAIFTNDPYIPVFSMLYVGKIGFFELTKSKKGREGVGELFESLCPKLTYPITDIKQLKKQIKQDNSVRGNLDVKFMLNQLDAASIDSGIFATKRMYDSLLPDSAAMLDGIGYIQEDEINKILHMDKMFNRNYWNKQMDRLTKMG